MHTKLVALLKRFAPVWIGLGIALVFSTSHFIIEQGIFRGGPLSEQGLLHYLDLKSLDLKFVNHESDDIPEPKVIIAAIDEKSIQKYGLWPWSRAVIGEFIRRTTEGGAKVIAFDAIFADEDKNASYQNIKRFVDDFEDRQLRPGSPLTKEVTGKIAEAKKSNAQAAAAIAELNKRIKKLKPGEGRGLSGSLAPLQAAIKKANRSLVKAERSVDSYHRNSEEFYSTMKAEVASLSPDQAFADAIASSPQTVLGMITFKDEEEFEGISPEQMKMNLKLVDKVAITDIYETTYIENVGELTRPVENIDMKNMWIYPIKGLLAPLSILSTKAEAFGYFNASPDIGGDPTIRSLRLLHKHEATGKLYPALSLITVAKYFDGTIKPLNSGIRPGRWLDGIQITEDKKIPTDGSGHLIVNYYKDPTKYFEEHSVADFIDGSYAPENYKDKVVLFGMTAHGLKQDLRPTAFGLIFGAYIHAMAIQNMIDGRYVSRAYGLVGLEMLLYLLLGLIMGLVFPRIPAWAGLLAVFGFAIALYYIDVLLVFPSGTWMYNVLPTLQVFLTFLGINVYGFLTEGREKRKIRKAFQYYLTESVVAEVLKDPTKLQLGGERRTCTVLFSDIRGFTTISERLSPEELVGLLNSYLTPMTNLIFKYDGTLDKYMGDAIMAIFGAPVAYKDHATRACHSALDQMEELARLQVMWRKDGLPEIDIGIGMNTGPMSVGNMGSEIRFDYTVMGDNVNLGSRLEGINKQYGTNIIISESTLKAARNDIYVRELDAVRVKGKREPVRIFELLGKGNAPKEATTLIETFESGIASYKGQKWDEALAAFETVRADLKPNDFASTMYIQRCETMRADPPGDDWDGVFTMKTK